MEEERKMKIIAHVLTPFPEKFGIPRQSNLVPQVVGKIVFEPEYRNPDAVKGIEDYSYLWILWEFSKTKQECFHATVAPPRLGGKERRGVFATRAPYRPNAIGLSSVRLERVEMDEKLGPVLIVSGVDILDGTPVFDIKPYLPYADAHPDARSGFAKEHRMDKIEVCFPRELLELLPQEQRSAAVQVLEQDPRAAYHKKREELYGMAFGDFDIRFTAEAGRLTVKEVTKRRNGIQKVK